LKWKLPNQGNLTDTKNIEDSFATNTEYGNNLNCLSYALLSTPVKTMKNSD
jgi:hypothetical protein